MAFMINVWNIVMKGFMPKGKFKIYNKSTLHFWSMSLLLILPLSKFYTLTDRESFTCGKCMNCYGEIVANNV